jgi:hypothetical protein
MKRAVLTGVGLTLALLVVPGCSASGSSGAGGRSSGSASGTGTGTAGGTAATGNIETSSGGSNASDPDCPHVEVNFIPKPPSVFVLVDRSDSMFTPDNTTQVVSWGPLKAGVLEVVNQLQSKVRFGFGAFTGQQGGTCPIFDTIAPALDNAAAISTLYQPLAKVAGPPGETPVIQVLPRVK